MNEQMLIEIFGKLNEQKKDMITTLLQQVPNDLVLGSLLRKVLYQIKDVK
jgi:hypothetical protein